MTQDNYKLIDAGNGLFIIEEPMVRSFLVIGSEKAVLIDSGCMINDIRSIVQDLTSLPVMLVNTHADPDHTHCSHQFKEIYMNPAEYAMYHHICGKKGCLKPLWDKDRISLGDRRLEVIMNPGHTSGSITLLDSAGKRLLGGDSIQNGNIFMFGNASRDLLAYLHGLERILEYADQFTLVYPSHAQCPVEKKIIKELIEGVNKMLAGNIHGTPESYENIPIRIFDLGCAKILYENDKTFFE